jgi:hypothetical protein
VLIAMLAGMLALASGCREGSSTSTPMHHVGLFTSLPILWNEYGEISELLKPEGDDHWVAAVVRRKGEIRPLDRLAPMSSDLRLLVMAQPRPLSPDENVALDEWVRNGGRLLLFADPMLTQQSAFALGDRRRPEGMVLLSPILARWGMALQFDDTQPPGEHAVEMLGATVPVNLSGSFALSENADCHLYADGLAARCRVGEGTVLAIADAALLEEGPEGDGGDRAAALQMLLDSITES